MLQQIKEKYGYTLDYILWGQAWNIFILEMADQPRYVRGTPPEEVEEINSAAEAAKMFGMK